MTEENVFEQMENESVSAMTEDEAKIVEQQINNRNTNDNGEVDYERLSDKGVGEKFERVLLDGKEVTIKKAQLFNADISKDKPVSALSDPSKKYYKCNFIIHYESPEIPEDKPQREYMSGIIQHVQKDGSLSAHNFWYEGSESQVASLWEAVAKKQGVDPKELSPRTFMAFLNSKPKAILEVKGFKNPSKNMQKTDKNMVKEFV